MITAKPLFLSFLFLAFASVRASSLAFDICSSVSVQFLRMKSISALEASIDIVFSHHGASPVVATWSCVSRLVHLISCCQQKATRCRTYQTTHPQTTNFRCSNASPVLVTCKREGARGGANGDLRGCLPTVSPVHIGEHQNRPSLQAGEIDERFSSLTARLENSLSSPCHPSGSSTIVGLHPYRILDRRDTSAWRLPRLCEPQWRALTRAIFHI